MNRTEIVLAALAAGEMADHSPVQLQKLFFLLDQKVASHIGGPHFNFRPYDYGPFDREVYDELAALTEQGQVEVIYGSDGRSRTYRLTASGLEQGTQLLDAMSQPISDYIRKLSHWIRHQSFAQLVSAIYREYPKMRVNSVFRG